MANTKKYHQKYREKNRARLVAYHKEWYKKNQKRLSEYNRKWFEKNRKKVYEYNRKWRRKNREKWNDIIMRWQRKNKDKAYFYKTGIHRNKILQRDNYQCQICKSKKKLEIHHMDGRGSRLKKKQRNNQSDNLITLCFKCHYKIDYNRRGYPYKGLLRWSRDFDKCIDCGTTKRLHWAKGLCDRCYELKRKEYKRKYYQKHYGVLTRSLNSAILN